LLSSSLSGGENQYIKEKQIMIDMDKEIQSVSITSAEVMNKITAIACVDAAFGEPVRQSDTVVIPCAEVSMGGGMGMGGGPSGNTEQEKLVIGMGSGVGGGATSRPIALIIMTQEGVRVQPIVDATKIALAFFTTATFMLMQIARLRRAEPAKSGKPLPFARMKKMIERKPSAL
jgi:uncharacterized spore protein YtfJ